MIKRVQWAMLLVALLLMYAAPSQVAAQSLFGKEKKDSMFDSPYREGVMGTRDAYSVNPGMFSLSDPINEDPTQAPLGSGIAVLVAAGAGYALIKRKEEQQ